MYKITFRKIDSHSSTGQAVGFLLMAMKIGKIYRTNPEFKTGCTISSAGRTEDYSYRVWDQPDFDASIFGVFDGETTECICKSKQDLIYDEIIGKKETFLLLEHITNPDPQNPWGWLKILTEKGLVGYIQTKLDTRLIEVFE